MPPNYISFSAATGIGTTPSIAALEAITQGLTIKMKIKGSTITGLGNFGVVSLIEIGSGAAAKFALCIECNGGGAGARQVRLVGAAPTGRGVGYAESFNVLQSTFSAAEDYIIYSHYDDSATPDRALYIYKTDGTVMQFSEETFNGGNLATGAGLGVVSLAASPMVGSQFTEGLAEIDGFAIYSAPLVGAARYAAPTAGDANLIEYWPFDEGAGALTEGALSSIDLSLVGHTWQAGGTWNAGGGGGVTTLTADKGAFVSTGHPAIMSLVSHYDTAHYILTGHDATFTVDGGAVVSTARRMSWPRRRRNLP